ncbi:hypothetical protein L7Q78_44720 [Achromobacter xylosoxidans]|nr:hypothetical protein [Achromobacter xylosoxidans]
MVNIRVQIRGGAFMGIFFFSQVPRINESVVINTAPFRVVDVRHVAGDPTDDNPPAFTLILVVPGP